MRVWHPIEMAPTDGTPVTTSKQWSGTPAWIGDGEESFIAHPYPLTSRFLEGRWCAEFDRGEWKPYDPQPTHWRSVPGPGSQQDAP